MLPRTGDGAERGAVGTDTRMGGPEGLEAGGASRGGAAGVVVDGAVGAGADGVASPQGSSGPAVTMVA